MNTGLNALNDARENLEEIDGHVGFDYGFEISEIKDDFSIIEKELKALEIILKKEPNLTFIKCAKNVDDYNYNYADLKESLEYLTREEFDLLKEVEL